jgi:hypothetical protein
VNTSAVTGLAVSPYHHGSHRSLLTAAKPAQYAPARVDAIIVPTARPVAYLDKAIALAGRLGCTLLALCSKLASAEKVAKAAVESEVAVVAVDIDGVPSGLMPSLKTSELLQGSKFERTTDTSDKRNLGLLLARTAGLDRIVFLDDDITVPRPADLLDAAGLLATHAGVGLANSGFPDNSVVCHAYREAGGQQDTFIGGGALAVGAASFACFFPNIYNEDWFFLLDDDRLRPSATTGEAVQSPYDPFSDERRARSEELGDCLAEGVFSLLDTGKRLSDADAEYWQEFLGNRRLFIEDVLHAVHAMRIAPDEKQRRITALKAARGRNQCITPEMCVEYLQAWRADRTLWRKHVNSVGRRHRRGIDLEQALDLLGIKYCGFRPVI